MSATAPASHAAASGIGLKGCGKTAPDEGERENGN
jgi:hypothetical protein